jgi:hypothetical protein
MFCFPLLSHPEFFFGGGVRGNFVPKKFPQAILKKLLYLKLRQGIIHVNLIQEKSKSAGINEVASEIDTA